jgi:diguanylate cyclase (GGDEF)-like protein
VSKAADALLAGRLKTLQRAIRNAATPLSPEEVLRAIMAEAKRLVPCTAWSLFLYDLEKQELEFHFIVGPKAGALAGKRLKLGEGIAGQCALLRHPLRVNNAAADRRHLKSADAATGFVTRSVLAVPLISRGRLLGVVEFLNRRGGGFTPGDAHLASSFIEVAALAVDNAFLLRRAEALAAHDDLTGLLNARTFLTRLDQEIARAKRFGGEFALLFMDLDGFKSVNDRHGHLVGSRTLAVVGSILQELVRTTDIVSRYGGDEFCMLLTHSARAGALVFAERVRQAVAEFPFGERLGYDISLTASIGLSLYPSQAADRSELLKKADAAMYAIKKHGKNGVQISS